MNESLLVDDASEKIADSSCSFLLVVFDVAP